MDISSLSLHDIVTTKANFEYVYRLRCDYLIEEHIKKGYTREVAEKTVRLENSCNKISETPIYVIDNIDFYTCPCNFRNRKFNFLLTALAAYENGVLPYPGSLSEQPAKAMEALILLSNLKEEYKIEQQNKAQQAQPRK